jgi:hypothetical protein
MVVLVSFRLDEHENGHAPDDAVLDGFVALGRFLGKQASPERHLRARRDGERRDRGMFTPLTVYVHSPSICERCCEWFGTGPGPGLL